MKASKSNVIGILIGVLFFALILPATLVFIVDPFRIYHDSLLEDVGFSANQRFQNAGLINTYLASKNSAYDTIIVGTSMSENLLPDLTREILGVRGVLQLSILGSIPREQYLLTRRALATGNVKNVIWEIDSFSVIAKDSVANNARKENRNKHFPEYLYNKSSFDDYKYLLNIDIQTIALNLLMGDRGGFERGMGLARQWHERAILRRIVRKRRGDDDVTQWARKRHYMTGFESWQSPFNPYLKMHYPRIGMGKLDNLQDEFAYPSADKNMISVIREHCNQDVQFYLYFVPAHMKTLTLRQIGLRRHFLNSVGDCMNVKIVDLASEDWVVSDLYNYKDVKHYRAEINNLILHYFVEGSHMLSNEMIGMYERKLVRKVTNASDFSSSKKDCDDRRYTYPNARMKDLELEYLVHTREVGEGRQNNLSLYMPRGWSMLRDGSYASVGCNSILYLLVAGGTPFNLEFHGRYLGENHTTHLWLNEVYIGDVDLRNFVIPMAEIPDDKNYLKIEMAHENAKYRYDMVRQSDYVLEEIAVEYRNL